MKRISGLSWMVRCLLVVSGVVWAKEDSLRPGKVNPNSTYTVIYQVSANETSVLEPVTLLDVVQMGSRAFLLVEVKAFGEKHAYLDLEAIRAIIER